MPQHDEPDAVDHPPDHPSFDLHADEIAMLDESLRLLGDRTDRMLSDFYAALFLEAPELRSLFPVSMAEQRDRFFRALTGAVRHFSEP